MSTVLDTIEVTVEHGGEELTLDVEITQWATKGGHEDPPEGAHWRATAVIIGPDDHWFKGLALDALLPKIAGKHHDAINDQVQEHCAERAAPGREG